MAGRAAGIDRRQMRLVIIKIFVWITLLLSLIFFFRGWVTFKQKYVRQQIQNDIRDIQIELNSLLVDPQQMMQLSKEFADYGVSIDPEEFAESLSGAADVLEDAAVSPLEFRSLLKIFNDFGEYSLSVYEHYGLADLSAEQRLAYNQLSDAFGTFRIVYIAYTILWIITIVSIVWAIAGLILNRKMSSVLFAVLNVAYLVLCIVIVARYTAFLKKLNTFSAYGSYGNIFSDMFALGKMTMSAAAFLAPILAIVSCVLMIKLNKECRLLHMEMPGLFTIIKNGEWKKKPARRIGTNRSISAWEKKTERCPNCGEIVPYGQSFCGRCGTKISGAKTDTDVRSGSSFSKMPVSPKCPRCGTYTEEGARFCEECGYDLLRETDRPDGMSDYGYYDDSDKTEMY